MRVVVQRVSSAKVTIGGEVAGEIGTGLLVFVGIEGEDGEEDGMVVQMDERFRLRLGLKEFSQWKTRSCVLGVRIKISEPEPPVERKFGRKD